MEPVEGRTRSMWVDIPAASHPCHADHLQNFGFLGTARSALRLIGLRHSRYFELVSLEILRSCLCLWAFIRSYVHAFMTLSSLDRDCIDIESRNVPHHLKIDSLESLSLRGSIL